MSVERTWPYLSKHAKDVILTLSGEDEDAIRVCVEIMENAIFIDPLCAKPLSPLYCLDALGIHDSKIFVFYKEVCHKHVGYMITLLRGVFLGILSEETLQYAIAHHGEGLDIEVIVRQVQELVPSFNPENVILHT